MATRAHLTLSLLLGLALAVCARAGGPFESDQEPCAQGPIDQAVFARHARLRLQSARLCSDGAFVRRVHLDALGLLPTADEVRAFLADPASGKRAALVDRLLAREELADYWALRWCDLLRVKAEFPINLWPNAARAYHRWVRTALRDGLPYDRFARELLTASGSNFRVPQVNFWRAVPRRDPEALAQAVAWTFLGARAELWPPEQRAGLAALCARVAYKPTQEWKEEVVHFDAVGAAEAAARGERLEAVLPDGSRLRLDPAQDPRRALADWLIRPDNPWFARAVVRRMWVWVFGPGPAGADEPRGPLADPAVLAALERELVDGGWDLRRLLRALLTSHTYQLAAVPRGDPATAEAELACYPIRRLDAEVLIDAIGQVTGTTEAYSSTIPEPYTIVPAGERAVALPDGSITTPFLELFGRPARDTGRDDERSNRATAAQRLHLLNSSHIREKLERSPTLRRLARRAARDPRGAVDELYLTLLSRHPTEDELGLLRARVGGDPDGAALADLPWALLNSAEFLYRH